MIANIYIFIRAFIRHKILHIDDRNQLDIAISNGLKMGKDCHVMGECIIDPGHCWLISIGDRVTLAPRVHILAHDASTKRELGQTRLGCVSIGDDVFIGAGSIILPGIRIGNKVVIGAGSVVSRSIPDKFSSRRQPGKSRRYL
ncbi:MAG: DapH/DapD/GlmU-related protein [Bacteroidaceae bacterium]|nr:DapH/DapD/GlmU-related protein [Bacteroidaceae bacterium]